MFTLEKGKICSYVTTLTFQYLNKFFNDCFFSEDYNTIRRSYLLNQGDRELASLDGLHAELDQRRAEIRQLQREIRSSTDLTNVGRGQGI